MEVAQGVIMSSWWIISVEVPGSANLKKKSKGTSTLTSTTLKKGNIHEY